MEKKEELLHDIATYLVINASFTQELGLFYGKMGCAIFFAHYSRYIQQEIYEDCMINLIDEIYEDIHNRIPIGFADGLCGIGWGLEYLSYQGFLSGDMSIVLKDIDLHVMEYDPYCMLDTSFSNGLLGIAYYIAYHNLLSNKKQSGIHCDFINKIAKSVRNRDFKQEDLFVNEIKSFYETGKENNSFLQENTFVQVLCEHASHVSSEKIGWEKQSMGLYDGLAGIGLKLMEI